MKVAAVVPARYQSTRLPGKPLADIAGEPMIRWVYERARRALSVDEVWVATDDERIFEAVRGFGGNCRMTSSHHLSGTDRLAEIAEGMDWDFVINVQGDEPLLDPSMVTQVINCLKENPAVSMATLKCKITSTSEITNPNVVKVVTDIDGYALYFSRAPVPFYRELRRTVHGIASDLPLSVFKHIGLYAYQRNFLLRFSQLEPTPLEKIERLEQLRALEYGFKIRVATSESSTIGVDTAEDLERVRAIVKSKGISCNPEHSEENIV